ncbi:MAG: GspH/FimT family pseudopilin [Gammaproteobacteria bacterium]
MDKYAGLTLLELLVVIAITALLAGIAVPALDRALLNARRSAAMESLLRAAWFARIEALRRGRPVILCGAAGGDQCAGEPDAWSSGWLVAAADAPLVALRRGPGATDRRARLIANRGAFSFEPHDRRSTNGTLAWCDDRGAAAARAIVIAPTGRPRLEHGAGSLGCPAP